MRRLKVLLALLVCTHLSFVLSACSGGGDGGPTCSFDNPATFASDSPWPKFRRDRANTGTIDLSLHPDAFERLRAAEQTLSRFPDGDPKGAFSASPTISNDGLVVYLGSNDGTLYAITAADWTQKQPFNFIASQALVSPALVASRDGKDAIFTPSLDGRVYGIDSDALAQASNWPFFGGVVIDRAPNLGTDGTVYSGSSSGMLFGICPNGVIRFSISFGDVTPVAVGPDGIVYVGSSDLLLRALRNDGLSRWSVAASQPISTAPVLQLDSTGETTVAIFVADNGGRVFKVRPNGQAFATSEFFFDAGSAIRSSPALADGRLYFGSDDGLIHAISIEDGREAPGWPVATSGPVFSSPAVARAANGRVVVVGSNDGHVYFISDTDGAPPVTRSYSIGAPVGSSPAIDYDGKVYVGAADGFAYRFN